jgi:hypothetical protein
MYQVDLSLSKFASNWTPTFQNASRSELIPDCGSRSPVNLLIPDYCALSPPGCVDNRRLASEVLIASF